MVQSVSWYKKCKDFSVKKNSEKKIHQQLENILPKFFNRIKPYLVLVKILGARFYNFHLENIQDVFWSFFGNILLIL